MNIELNYLLRGRYLGRMLRLAETIPFPEVIGIFMGRDVLSLAISCLDLDSDDAVLLPAYLCREVVKPFLRKTQVKFYDLRPDMGGGY